MRLNTLAGAIIARAEKAGASGPPADGFSR